MPNLFDKLKAGGDEDAKKKKVKKDVSSSSAGFSSKPINNPHGSSGPTKKSSSGDGFKNPFAKGKNPLAQIGDMIQSSQKAHEAKKKRSTEHRGGGKSLGGVGGGESGSADARREAVIAAAEARDKAHRAKTKPTKSSSSGQQPPATLLSTAERRQVELERQQRAQQLKDQNAMSEEAQKAIQKAKADEATHAASLGYNPYETAKMNAGQARTATTTMTHGTVGATTDKSTTTSSSSSQQAGTTSLPAVAPPTAVAQAEEEMVPVSEAFEEAFATLVTSNTDPGTVASALHILQKLVKNASTKQDDKFKRIRLANPKIKAAVSDVHGALELLLTVGFTLFEEDATGETILVYSPDQNDVPAWLPTALHQMQQYEQTTNTK